jgi:hypothetical protein
MKDLALQQDTLICFPRRSNYAFPGIVGIISAIAKGNAPQNLQQDYAIQKE